MALRIALAALDGGSDEWIASRFCIAQAQIDVAKALAHGYVNRHIERDGAPIEDIEAYVSENIEQVVGLLVAWIDQLGQPVHRQQSSLNFDSPDEPK